MAKHTEKFDPNEVEGLVVKAKSGDIVARDELLYRFQRLVATLVHVCITGRPNYWSSYQKTFLRMFASKDKPLEQTAGMLKTNLAHYEKEELFSTGQLAVLLAIERCETNLASTIVICFKDLIHKMIKDPNAKNLIELDESCTYEVSLLDDNLALDIFYSTLNDEEATAFICILDGNKTKIPETLREKFLIYLG